MKHVITIFIALILCLSTGLVVLADTKPTSKGSGYGIIGSNQKIKIFAGIAKLDLKKGWEFLDNRAYYRWSVDNSAADIQESDYQPFRDENGVLISDAAQIWPMSDWPISSGKENWPEWNAELTYEGTGHMKEIYKINENRLLMRSGPGTDFHGEPAYDYKKHALSWCLRHADSGEKPWIQYWEIIFTKEGYLQIMLNCREQDEANGLIKYIQNAITITSGNTYRDFNPKTDSIYNGYYGDSIIYGDGGTLAGFLFDLPAGLIVACVVAALLIMAFALITLVRKSRRKRKAKI